jgi:hypothetical protein
MRKSIRCLFLLFILSCGIISLVLANCVKASVDYYEISKTSVPEFTVKLADNSYDVPTSYSIDPFTGENITHHGYYVENRTIEVAIKNQPFTSTNIDGNTTQLFYVVRWKGHFEDWADYDNKSGISVVGYNFDYDYYLDNYGVRVSNSDYTVKTYTLGSFGNIPANGQIDFQVKAQVGYSYAVYGDHPHIMPIGINFKVVEESNWSSTQTVTFEENAIPEFPSWTFLALFLSLPIAVLFFRNKIRELLE